MEGNRGNPLTCIEQDYCNKPAGSKPVEKDGCEVGLKWVDCKCKTLWCDKCQVGRMVTWREHLRPIVQKWRDVNLITLTVDRKPFTGPYAAWDHVGKKRGISVLMQTLRRMKRNGREVLHGDEWISALEFQMKTGEGWPHWHVLTHSSFVPVELIRKAWKLGHVSITSTKEFGDKIHAMHYLTKYLVKPQDGIPRWAREAKDSGRRIRLFSTSRGIGLDAGKKRWVAEEGRAKREYRVRTTQEMIEKCGKDKALFLKRGKAWLYLMKVHADADAVEREKNEKRVAQAMKMMTKLESLR